MREIPSLRTLALRAVGPARCNPELTFGGPGAAPPRSAAVDAGNTSDSDGNDDGGGGAPGEGAPKDGSSKGSSSPDKEKNKKKDAMSYLPPEEPTLTSRLLRSLRTCSHLKQQPYRSPCRPNANDVDISQPWIMAAYPPREVESNAPLAASAAEGGAAEGVAASSGEGEFLTIENTNHAVECLQLFVDALVESGRAGDDRMGVHFFREWVAAATGRAETRESALAARRRKKKRGGDGGSAATPGRSKKKQKTNGGYAAATASAIDEELPLGSLSLHNFSAGSIRTFRSMERANVGACLGTLDISGVHGLTDQILSTVICGGSFPRLRRLSVKNCRKLTGRGVASLVNLPDLSALDIGGCFNVHPNDVVSLVRAHPSTRRGEFREVYASGLGWTDVALEEIVDATAGMLRGLGVGFSPYISGPGLILTLSKVAGTLDRLAVPFCPGMDDSVASALGGKLPRLAVLDVRGCGKLYSLSGMMEGRVGAASASSGKSGHLFVLARYSGVSNNSLDETMRLYEHEGLTCVLDGGGIGGGIRR